MLRCAVLVSGGGTNLQALIDARKEGRLADTEFVLVFSNRKDAFALQRAKDAGIQVKSFSPKDFTDRKKFEEALYDLLLQVSPDLIVLAGFLLKVPDSIVMHFENRIINIHPSLIPSFCGEGAYGIKVHEMALQRGVRVSGATVHFVDKGMDTGPILLQKAVDVRQGDTPQSLQKRIMEQAEWQILPLAVDWISRGKVKVNAQHRVEIEDEDQ